MKSIDSRQNWTAHAVAIAVVCCWGCTFVNTKYLLMGGMLPWEIFVCRFLLAYIAIWTISPRRLLADNWKDEALMCLLGLTGGSLYFLAENEAIGITYVNNVSFIVCTAPLITVVLALFFLRGVRASWRLVVGSLLALLGVALVIFNGHFVLHLNPLGDWLALDTEDIMKLKGKTPDDLIASAYYYSAKIVSQAAEVLGMKHEYQYYRQLSRLIKEAFIKHFYTPDGLAIANTQTGLALCLEFGLYPAAAKKGLVNSLVTKIEGNRNHLDTGFVGTPLLLPALTHNGQEQLALRLFLNTDFPSWLYEVKKGATTIWERWNSVEEDGHIAKNGMNSLNHYSSGAVIAWAYEDLVGLTQAGKNVIFKPLISSKFKEVAGQVMLPTGLVKASVKLEKADQVTILLEIPLGSQVKLDLPAGQMTVNGQAFDGELLKSGSYTLQLQLEAPIVEACDVHTPLKEFASHAALTEKLSKLVPFWGFLTIPGNLDHFGQYSLFQLSREMRGIGFKPFEDKDIESINQVFKEYALGE